MTLACFDDGRPFPDRVLCPGGSLTRWMTADPRPSQRRVRDVGVRIADALSAAHLLGVLHQDVKPANILIDAYNNAGWLTSGWPRSSIPTRRSARPWKPSPRRTRRRRFAKKPLTEYADVYSLAATLYAVLSGHAPRWSETTEMPSIPRSSAAEKSDQAHSRVDKAFMDVLLAPWPRNPEDRPTAAQFRDQLTALNLSTQQRHGRWMSRRNHHLHRLVPLREPVAAKVGAAASRMPGRWERRGSGDRGDRRTGHRRGIGDCGGEPRHAYPGRRADARRDHSNVPTASPTAVVVPAGFIDCSEQLGRQHLLRFSTGMLGGCSRYSDIPDLATPYDCDKVHVYQTFIAGRLTYDVRRQSQLDSDATSGASAPTRLRTRCWAPDIAAQTGRSGSWVRNSQRGLFRCIIGRGRAVGAVQFRAPG